MSVWPRRLVLCSLLLLVAWVVFTLVAVERGWPAEFGRVGDPDDVAGDWLSRGTLLSPPLAPMAVQAFLTILALFERRPALAVAGLGVAALGALYTVAGVGEPFHPDHSDPPLLLYSVAKGAGLAGSLGLVITGVETGVGAIRGRVP
jgi:hypothetical protein